MNKREQQQFAAFFQEIYESQELFDFLKIELTQNSTYNPNLLFDLISERTETINLNQMRFFLSDKVECSERELYEIFEKFDWSRQGFISRIDFLNQIRPFGRDVESFKFNGCTITAELEGQFISLFFQILKRFRILQIVRKQLKFIQAYDAFAQIDNNLVGHLSISSLRQFLFQNDFNVTDKQLYYLMHGLRRRCYKLINLQVFCQNLNPLQFGEYIAYQYRFDKQKQQQLLSRSRSEQQTIKRSRVQAQRIEHEFQKAERKRQAQIQRQFEMQKQINDNIIQRQFQNQRLIRKAQLEQDKEIRTKIIAGKISQQNQMSLHSLSRHQNSDARNNIEENDNKIMKNNAQYRQKQLERSRRQLEQQRKILQKQKKHKNSLFRNNEIINQIGQSRYRKMQDSKDLANSEKISKISNNTRNIQQQKLLQRMNQNIKQMQQNRRRQEENNRKNNNYKINSRQLFYQEMQFQKQKAKREIQLMRNNRANIYEKDLEKIRYQNLGRISRKKQNQPSYYLYR